MASKCVLITEEDYKQAMILSKVMLEGKFELKGDAVPMVHKAQMWLANHLAAMRNPLDYPPLQKAAEPAPAPVPEPIKKTKRKKV
jgi:hypothetical protein